MSKPVPITWHLLETDTGTRNLLPGFFLVKAWRFRFRSNPRCTTVTFILKQIWLLMSIPRYDNSLPQAIWRCGCEILSSLNLLSDYQITNLKVCSIMYFLKNISTFFLLLLQNKRNACIQLQDAPQRTMYSCFFYF